MLCIFTLNLSCKKQNNINLVESDDTSALVEKYDINRVEPLNWWVSFKNSTLQLLVHHPSISERTPEISYSGVSIEKVHQANSPNYLFIDLNISENTKAGKFNILFKQEGKDDLIQTYQYHKGIISWWDMNWNKYSYSFMKTNDSYQDCLGGNNDILPFNPQIDTVYSQKIIPGSIASNVEIGSSTWSPMDKKEVIDYSNSEFNFKVTIPVNKDFISERGIYILANLKRKELVSSNENKALFVVDISDSAGNNYHYGTFIVSEIPPVKTEKWIQQKYSIEIKEIRNPTDLIKIYIWNQGKQAFWIDGVEIKVLAIN